MGNIFLQIRQKKYLLLWSLLVIVILFSFNFYNFYDSDEGVLYEGAWRLAQGQKIYFDFFEYVPPGGFYFVYFLWMIFGISYVVPKAISLFIIFFSCIGLLKIAKYINAEKNIYLLLLVFALSTLYWPIVHYHTYFLFLSIFGAYYFLIGFDKKSLKHIIISGIIIGISTFFVLHKGLIVFFVFSSYLLVLLFKTKNKFFIKSLIALVLSFILIQFLYIFWPPELLFRHLIYFPANNYLEVNRVSLFLFFIFLFGYVVLVWYLRRSNAKIVFLMYLQGVVLLFSIQRPDIYHISIGIAFAYCLIPLLWASGNQNYFLFKNVVCVVFSMILLFPFYNIYQLRFLSLNNSAQFFSYINKNCHTENIYFGPFMPQMYFASRKINQTPYPFLVTGFNTKEQFAEVAELLVKNPPDCIAMNYGMVKKFGYNQLNPVDNLIHNYYALNREFGEVKIFKIKTNK